jgi:aspartate/methionine/tyrosine aminotransferase
MAFAHHLLQTAGVAVAPGIDFDTVDGGRFVRRSLPGPRSEIEEALERLSTALDR